MEASLQLPHADFTGRERKRELFGDTLEAAVQAEASGDRQSLYTAIRKLAPKTPRLKTQVRGPQGQLLSQEEENLEFMTYCQDLFALPTWMAAQTH